MKMEPHIATRIARNALLSVFIYALPVILMLLTFYVSGQRPWKNKPVPKEKAAAENSVNHR